MSVCFSRFCGSRIQIQNVFVDRTHHVSIRSSINIAHHKLSTMTQTNISKVHCVEPQTHLDFARLALSMAVRSNVSVKNNGVCNVYVSNRRKSFKTRWDRTHVRCSDRRATKCTTATTRRIEINRGARDSSTRVFLTQIGLHSSCIWMRFVVEAKCNQLNSCWHRSASDFIWHFSRRQRICNARTKFASLLTIQLYTHPQKQRVHKHTIIFSTTCAHESSNWLNKKSP